MSGVWLCQLASAIPAEEGAAAGKIAEGKGGGG